MENLTVSVNVTNHAANDPITDSAAGATAMACGIKTDRGVLGMTPDGVPVENIVEIAQSMNKTTGLISTATVSHATPAGFYAHIMNRYEYDAIEAQSIASAFIKSCLSDMIKNLKKIGFEYNKALDKRKELIKKFHIDETYTTIAVIYLCLNRTITKVFNKNKK